MSGVYRKYKNSVFLKLKCLVTCSESPVSGVYP